MASFTFGYGGAYGYRGSLSLAQILYQTSLGDFTYNTDSSGNVVLTNQGNLGTSYDGLPYSGRGIELGATNDVDIPIHHTLGAELVTNGAFDADTDWTKGTGWTIAAGVASSDGTQVADSFLTTSTIPTTAAGDTYLISFEVTAYTAGNVALQFDGIEIIPDKAVVGVYSAEAIASDTTGTVDIVADLNFVGSIDNVTVKQITNPNSYLTYYDFTDGLVTLGNSVDGGSSEELVDTANDATEWTAYGNNTVEQDVDAVKITYIDTNNGAYVDLKSVGGLSQDFIIGRTYLVECYAKINTGSALIRVYDGVTNDTSLTSTIYTKITQVITPTTVSCYINTPTIESGEIIWIKDISVKEILPISTTYTLNNKTVNNVLTHTTNWSALDWSKINNNPNLVGKLAVETLGATKTIAELDMELDQGASADKWFMCSEPTLATLYNSRSTDSITIANYADTVRTNADLQQKGIQTTAFVTDGAGVPTSFTGNILNFTALEYIDTQWNPSLETEFWLEEVIDGVVYQHNYDGVNLTTYTDNLAGAPAAHSPENASYLLGKGVYPKVTADPYTSYQSKTFAVYTGSRYTSYDQSARYTILAAL